MIADGQALNGGESCEVTKALSLFVGAASLALALLSRQGWWNVGWYPMGTVAGPDVRALSYIGDGDVILLGALMTSALGLVSLLHGPSRRLSGLAIALAGAAMLGVTVYDIVQVPSLSDYVLDSLIDRAAPTKALYFSAVTSGLIVLLGLLLMFVTDDPREDEEMLRGDEQSMNGGESWA